jgi:hypothetical protein
VQGAAEHLGERFRVKALTPSAAAGAGPTTRLPSPSENDGAEREISAGPPRPPFRPFRRRVGPAYRRAQSGALQCLGDAKVDETHFAAAADEQIARMQRAVVDALAGGAIQRLGQAAQRHDDGFERRRAVLPERRVERVPVGVVLSEVRGRPFDPSGQRRGDRGMLRLIGGQIFERCRQLRALLGRRAKPEDLQRDETIAGRVVRAKNGTEAACPNLMQDAKGTTGGRGRVESGSVSVQRWCSSADLAVERS